MEGLSKYFQKIKLVLQDKTEEKRVIQEIVQIYTKVVLHADAILIKNSIAILTLTPIERVEIIMNKKQILSALKERGVIITDLR